ncbi:MORN repeat-containing protein 5 like protein [Aduncisulcus paluster]|uniref:MORN repeat-containing protein 5 n=1 Tax=Aduncisulcus paluster TaxID=2918883 RepID=A0ABQ5JZ81_9EUKA|nr:MORN repeat-containing protein 5 like protein [Aduncisulcus paluster]|eukprot:gnl/Carplike_NY0171/5694_a7805_252.p1 GENE.gnl/Carplike_NY0171/5694_a7805_252~~gnl/Carplike_NY0171/5694_a7805_252.p1  ORF type:complete len:173 (-),score=39.84 gnl/Carplike_NY0171/5694_a7805_252:252-770(-)
MEKIAEAICQKALDLDIGRYEGETLHGEPHGKGELHCPTGEVYKGSFKYGKYHGEGRLEYEERGVFIGTWEEGELRKGEFIFSDGLVHAPKEWKYCREDGDRRVHSELIQKGVNVKPFLPDVPVGSYYVGGGCCYKPITGKIHSIESDTVIRTPDKEEITWIKKNCLVRKKV